MTQFRKAERLRSFLSAQVVAGNSPPVECVVKNFSTAGVRLEIADRTPLPAEFELNIPHKNRVYRARVVWRGDGIVGAEFLENGGTGASDGHANENDGDKLDRLMKENAKLRTQILLLKQRVAELTGES